MKTAESAQESVNKGVNEPSAPKERRLTVWLFGAVAAIAFLIYLRTLAPGLTFGDGPELATAAYVLGVPHPTGYPLYMLLLRLWMFLPLGEPIVMSNMFSAFCGALAAGCTAVLLRRTLPLIFPAWPTKAFYLAAGAGALTTALLKLLWENSIVTEVYSLHLLITLAFLLATAHFAFSGYSPRAFLVAALCLGLGLAHHRLSTSLVPPLVIMAFLGARKWPRAQTLRVFGAAVLLVLLCLSFYIYIPLRAAAHPPINWGDCTTWENFLKHVTGSDYLRQRLLRIMPGAPIILSVWFKHAYLTLWQLVGDLAAQAFPVHLDQYLIIKTHQYFRPTEGTFALGIAILLTAAVGYWRWVRSQHLLGITMGLIAAHNMSIVLLYNIADISDYTVFLFWLIYLSAFLGVIILCEKLVYPSLQKFLRPRAEYAYALAAIPAAFFIFNLHEVDQSANNEAEGYSYFVLPLQYEEMPENSILLTSGDYDSFCSWYRQIVRGERRDVFVFGANFIGSPWYAAFFTPEQLQYFRIKFHHRVPQSPEEYAQALRDGIIDYNIHRHRIFTTLSDAEAMAILANTYEFKIVGKKLYVPRDILGLTICYLYEIVPKATGVTKP